MKVALVLVVESICWSKFISFCHFVNVFSINVFVAVFVQIYNNNFLIENVLTHILVVI